MTRRTKRTLTPIGDELARHGRQVEAGEPTIFDALRRVTRRPKNRAASVAYGLGLFVLIVGALVVPAYGLGLLLDRHSNLGHDLALLVVFLLLGAVSLGVGLG